jgi:hypothetical protein
MEFVKMRCYRYRAVLPSPLLGAQADFMVPEPYLLIVQTSSRHSGPGQGAYTSIACAMPEGGALAVFRRVPEWRACLSALAMTSLRPSRQLDPALPAGENLP